MKNHQESGAREPSSARDDRTRTQPSTRQAGEKTGHSVPKRDKPGETGALLLCLMLSACGSPFTSGEHLMMPDDDAATEASDTSDSNVAEAARHEGGHHEAEAGVDTGAPVDGGTDTPVTSDAPPPPIEAGHDVTPPPVDAGCTPFVAKAPNVCSMGVAPATFCTFFEISSSYLATTTPVECQCEATFTCACLYAHGVDTSSFCAGGGTPTKCTDNANSGPSVECP